MAAVIIIAVFPATPASAQSGGMMLDNPGGEQISGKISAKKLSTGRIEFGWLPSGSDERVLPRIRFFPANPTVDHWLSSSPVEVAGTAIGHIEAQRLHDGRTEFTFTPTDWSERIYPNVRYFPADARVGRWLNSSEITFTPGPDTGADTMVGEGEDTEDEPPPEPPTTTTQPTGTTAPGYRDISSGRLHTCAIRSDGAIECWGSDTNEGTINGEPHVVRTGRTIAPAGSYRAVAAGQDHTCAIRTNGAIECWGSNAHGQTANIPTGRFSAISTDNIHTCALREDGAIRCWGANQEGQSNALTGRFTAVSAGFWHSCGLRESGAIECWGANHYEETDAPAGRFTAISEGSNHTCAIRASNSAIVCWGRSEDGQTSAPAGSYRAVSTGSFHTCAIRTSGALACWGANHYGESDAPTGTFRAVSAGFGHTCAIRESGEIACWGANSEWIDFGQADPPSSAASQPPPEPPTTTTPPPPAAAGYTAVSVNINHACAIRSSDGAIECWGPISRWQNAPAGRFIDVSAGTWHTCGLHEVGAIECWGNNEWRQTIAPPGRFRAISAGVSHTCGLHENGAIECWGSNAHGKSSAPAGSYRAVNAGQDHTCALRESGAIACWGSNTIPSFSSDGEQGLAEIGRTDAPPGSYTAVSVGGLYTCGLRNDGSITCWGWFSPPPTGRFTAISAGDGHACAIRASDSAIVCWGDNYDGKTDAPAGSYRAVSAGQDHTCAIRISDGVIACWGKSTGGRTDPPSTGGGDSTAPEGTAANPEPLDFGESEPVGSVNIEGGDSGELGGGDDGDSMGPPQDAGDQPPPEPRVGTGTTRLQRDSSVTMYPSPTNPLQARIPSAEDTSYGYIIARLGDDGRIEFGWQTPSGQGYFPSARYFPTGVTHERWLRSAPLTVAGTEIGRINVRQRAAGVEFAFTPIDGERIEPSNFYFPDHTQVGIWLRTGAIGLDPQLGVEVEDGSGMSDE